MGAIRFNATNFSLIYRLLFINRVPKGITRAKLPALPPDKADTGIVLAVTKRLFELGTWKEEGLLFPETPPRMLTEVGPLCWMNVGLTGCPMATEAEEEENCPRLTGRVEV